MQLDEKTVIERYKLVVPCSVKHDWNQDSKGTEICQVIKKLQSLPNYVHGLYNQQNSGSLFGGSHYILLREPDAPHNYLLIKYRDRHPESVYPTVRKYTCPLSNVVPRKIYLNFDDIAQYGCSGESFKDWVEIMLKECSKAEGDVAKEKTKELGLLSELMTLHSEMKTFVEKETADRGGDYSHIQPKPNIDSFGGEENLFLEDDEDDWRTFVSVKKSKGWKKKKIV